MVDVAHHGNDGRAGNEALYLLHGIGLLFDEFFLCRLFGLIFELYAEVGGYHERRFVVYRAVHGSDYAVFEQALGYLYRGNAELFGEHFDGDIVGSDDGMFDLDRLHDLLCGLFGAHLAVYAPLVVEILHACALLFLERALVQRPLFLFAVSSVAALLFIGPEVFGGLCRGGGCCGTRSRGGPLLHAGTSRALSACRTGSAGTRLLAGTGRARVSVYERAVIVLPGFAGGSGGTVARLGRTGGVFLPADGLLSGSRGAGLRLCRSGRRGGLLPTGSGLRGADGAFGLWSRLRDIFGGRRLGGLFGLFFGLGNGPFLFCGRHLFRSGLLCRLCDRTLRPFPFGLLRGNALLLLLFSGLDGALHIGQLFEYLRHPLFGSVHLFAKL